MESRVDSGQAAPPAAVSARPAYKWWVVLMLWFVCFFNYADRQAIFSVFPVLQKEFGFSNQELGLIGSAFGYVYGACALFAGFTADRVRRTRLILGGCLFWSMVTVTTSWCSRLWHFVTVRALEGLGETFYFPASMSLVSDYHGPKTRSRAMSFHQSSVYVGTIMGSWLGAVFAERWGWRVGFYFFGASGMILAVVLWRFLVEPQRGASELGDQPPPASPGFFVALRDVFRTPTAPLLMVVFVGANFVATIFLTWTPKFLTDKFDFKLGWAGLTGAVFINVASAMAVPLAGTAADWLARRFAGGRMLAQAGGLLIGAAFVSTVGLTRDIPTLLVAMSIFGICKGFYDAGIFASLYDVVHPRSRATAAGLMNTVGWGLGSLGSFFTGWYSDHGPYASKVENMSHFIAYGGAIYIGGAVVLLFAVFVLAKRDVRRTWEG